MFENEKAPADPLSFAGQRDQPLGAIVGSCFFMYKNFATKRLRLFFFEPEDKRCIKAHWTI